MQQFPEMQLQAVPTLEISSWAVLFRFIDEGECVVTTAPAITIPCDSYEHAKDVAQAFNRRKP